MLSIEHACRIKPLLDSLLDARFMVKRREQDPVRFPHLWTRAEDIEVAALLSSSLAYGRVEGFMPKLQFLFDAMRPSPSAFARRFDPDREGRLFEHFVYRFNTGADIAALIGAAGRLQDEWGSLDAAFGAGLVEGGGSLREGLAAFARKLRCSIHPAIARTLGPPRGLGHLLPRPELGGACKRMLLFLRWMVRGGRGDPIDFGLWRSVRCRDLIVPLDTHVARIARALGMTNRRSMGWATAEEITQSLRLLDAKDPTRYDFILCHMGMSGAFYDCA
jgi:uncharacterized protein (TIGR02757 family)